MEEAPDGTGACPAVDVALLCMPGLLEQLFSLYRDSFPENERRNEADLRAALSTPQYQILTKVQNGKMLGFAILFKPPDKDFALLEYLAVAFLQRSRGVGRELVLSAIEDSHGRHLLVEVETESNGPDAMRRQRFYRRCGFKRIAALAYDLPLPGNPPPMQLWIYPRGSEPQILVGRNDLSRWITAIYTGVYSCTETDPRIERMLATLPAVIPIDQD